MMVCSWKFETKVDDELEEIIPKKVRKPSKPKGTLSDIEADPDESKSKKSKPREPTPEDLTEESSRDSIVESEIDTSNTSIEEESSISIEQPKKARGRPPKSTPQQSQKPPRARSVSVQPKVKSTPSSTAKPGVRGRKPKLSVVPETQMDISVVEEVDEIEEVELAPRPRQGSILPASVMRKTSSEVQPGDI